MNSNLKLLISVIYGYNRHNLLTYLIDPVISFADDKTGRASNI